MSHEIDQTVDQQGAMAYVGAKQPWHSLGHEVPKGASPKEIGKKATMLWPVLMKPAMFFHEGKYYSDAEHQMMVRGDTMAVLDITGKGYIPHQNLEVLEFFAEYIAAGEMFIDTAGVLQGGKYIWVQAALNEGFKLPGNDQVNGRVLLMNPHQYGKGMIAKVVMERVVCRNTLNMALGEGGKTVKIWHTKEFTKARRDEVKQNLGIARERVDAFKHDAKKLVALKLDLEDGVKLIAPAFNGDPAKELAQQNRTITRLVELWQGAGMGAALPSAAGTAWGLLNAVTQYFDHEYGRSDDSRLSHAWLGQGDIKKREVLKTLLAAA